jgi:hypothetical protein
MYYKKFSKYNQKLLKQIGGVNPFRHPQPFAPVALPQTEVELVQEQILDVTSQITEYNRVIGIINAQIAQARQTIEQTNEHLRIHFQAIDHQNHQQYQQQNKQLEENRNALRLVLLSHGNNTVKIQQTQQQISQIVQQQQQLQQKYQQQLQQTQQALHQQMYQVHQQSPINQLVAQLQQANQYITEANQHMVILNQRLQQAISKIQ